MRADRAFGGTIHKMTAFLDSIPKFMRRLPERVPAKLAIKFPNRYQAVPVPRLPRNVIHGGMPPVQPEFAALDEATTAKALGAPEAAVVDLTARRSAASKPKPAPREMSRALHAAFEGEPGNFEEDDDVAFQVTLPRSVIRQIRVFAAEQGTTHRAVVLRALRVSGLSIPEGADVDRRAVAAKRRHQA